MISFDEIEGGEIRYEVARAKTIHTYHSANQHVLQSLATWQTNVYTKNVFNGY